MRYQGTDEPVYSRRESCLRFERKEIGDGSIVDKRKKEKQDTWNERSRWREWNRGIVTPPVCNCDELAIRFRNRTQERA